MDKETTELLKEIAVTLGESLAKNKEAAMGFLGILSGAYQNLTGAPRIVNVPEQQGLNTEKTEEEIVEIARICNNAVNGFLLNQKNTDTKLLTWEEMDDKAKSILTQKVKNILASPFLMAPTATDTFSQVERIIYFTVISFC